MNRFQLFAQKSRRTSTFLNQLIFSRENILEITNSNMLKIKFENNQKKIHSQFTKNKLKTHFENNIIAFNKTDKTISNIIRNDNKKTLNSLKIMLNAQQMLHEHNSSTFNINNKF